MLFNLKHDTNELVRENLDSIIVSASQKPSNLNLQYRPISLEEIDDYEHIQNQDEGTPKTAEDKVLGDSDQDEDDNDSYVR